MKCKFREGGTAYARAFRPGSQGVALNISSEIRDYVNVTVRLTPTQAKALGSRLLRLAKDPSHR